MSQAIVVIVHYADPGFMPHVRRQAQTLSEREYRIWAVGISHPAQKTHAEDIFYRKDVLKRPSWAERGPLAFLFFFVAVFIVLWKDRPAFLQPVDVPALLPCYIHSVLRGIPMYYFSLEDTPALTCLTDRPLRRAIWTFIESWCIKGAVHVAVVAEMDAKSLEKRCRIPHPRVVRNTPELTPLLDRSRLLLRKKFGWTASEHILMYHGMTERGRGIELVFPLLHTHPTMRLAIAGYGPYTEELKKLAHDDGLSHRIGWVGSYVHEELGLWLQDADVGVILLEKVSKGNYQALPCKLFECVHAGVPVVASDFPEIRRYVEATNVGVVVDPADSDAVAEAFARMVSCPDVYRKHKEACFRERKKTNWSTESRAYLAFLDISE